MSGAARSYFGAASLILRFLQSQLTIAGLKGILSTMVIHAKNRLSLTDLVRILYACVAQMIKEDGAGHSNTYVMVFFSLVGFFFFFCP